MSKTYYRKKHQHKKKDENSRDDYSPPNENENKVNHLFNSKRKNYFHNKKCSKTKNNQHISTQKLSERVINDDYNCVLDATNFALAKGSDHSIESEEYFDYEFQEQYTTSYLKSISMKMEDVSNDDEKHIEQSFTTAVEVPIICNPFMNFFEYSHYKNLDTSSHLSTEEFKHIYHTIRYIISSLRTHGKYKSYLSIT